jgi:hypothetical protein
MRVARAAQERTLRCWERGHRRCALRQTKLKTRGLQAVPPATGTLIGHHTGRVIRDSPKPSSCKQPQPAIPHSAPDISDSAFHLPLGLGFGDVSGAAFGDGVHAALPTYGVTGAVGGRRSTCAARQGRSLRQASVARRRSVRDPAAAISTNLYC